MKLNFQEEGHLYANCILYILTFCHKWHLFQFLGYGIRMQIIILTGVWKRHSGYKNGHILLKMYFWSLTSKVKVTCMLIAYFIFWFFAVNSFFFSSLVVAYLCTFSPNGGSKRKHNLPKNNHNLLRMVLFEAYFPRWRLFVCQLLVLYSEYLLFMSFFISYVTAYVWTLPS